VTRKNTPAANRGPGATPWHAVSTGMRAGEPVESLTRLSISADADLALPGPEFLTKIEKT